MISKLETLQSNFHYSHINTMPWRKTNSSPPQQQIFLYVSCNFSLFLLCATITKFIKKWCLLFTLCCLLEFLFSRNQSISIYILFLNSIRRSYKKEKEWFTRKYNKNWKIDTKEMMLLRGHSITTLDSLINVPGTFINFWNFFQGVRSYLRGYVYWIWRFLNTKLKFSQKTL